MKRFLYAVIAAALMQPLASSADVDVHISVPAPPQIVFRAEPQVVLVPETRVYYVPEASAYDMYRYGSYWYVNNGGYWYRSHAYSGPFTVVAYERVPQQIFSVPVQYRHQPARHDKHRGKHSGKHNGKHDKH
jgi:hypothetical protein